VRDAATDIHSLRISDTEEVSYTAEHRSTKNARIELQPEGHFKVILPSGDDSAEDLLKENRDWVLRQQSRLQEQINTLDTDTGRMLEDFVLWGKPFTLERTRGQFNITIHEDSIRLQSPRNRDELAYLKNWVRDTLRTKVTRSAEKLTQQLDLDFDKVYIRNQQTKWASCSSLRNLNFNIRCAFLPPEHLNYLVAHEVVHLKHPHHGDEFWNELESLGINTCDSQAELDGYWLLANRNKIWSHLLARF
jgi:predicted metal-dependent hydrolase